LCREVIMLRTIVAALGSRSMLYEAKIRADKVRLAVTYPAEYQLYRKLRPYSMIPRRRFVADLREVRNVKVDGDLVECGTWNGGMSAALATVLPGRISVLFDSFEGLPEPETRDGVAAAELMERDRLVADVERARSVMTSTGQKFEVHQGWFNETVPAWAAQKRPIAVLRLDGDWYESTMVCLEHLFPLLAVGGLLVIDDYLDWVGCRRAVHDYFAREERPEAIRTSAGSDAYVVKESLTSR